MVTRNATGIATGAAATVLTGQGVGVTPVWAVLGVPTLTWSESTASPVAAAVNNGYVANMNSLCTINLPAVAAIGEIVHVIGKGTGLWSLVAAAGDVIHFGNQDSSAGGSLTATHRYDTLQVVCTEADSEWTCTGQTQGNLTVA
jgi:hypothetical protein